MARRDTEVVLEDVQLIYRNFEGKEKPFNRPGDRNFCVVLEEPVALAMKDDGWNIAVKESRGDDPEEGPNFYYLKVKVSYNERARPPQIFLITGDNRTPLGEDELEVMDWGDFELVDLIIAPFDWDINGKTGRTAYLRSIYATLYVDPLMRKYGVISEGRDEE